MSSEATKRFRPPRSLDGWLVLMMIVVVLGLVGYVGYGSLRTSRRSPPREYRPPVHPVSLVGAPIKGNPNARVAIVVHSDFMCPACGRFALTMLPRLQENYLTTGKAFLALRHTPIGVTHSLAPRAAEAAFCAGEQGKFWEMYDAIFRAQLTREYGRTEAALFDRDIPAFASTLKLETTAFGACLTSDRAAERVYLDAGSALALGIESTPSIMVGAVQGSRIKVLRHFRGLPREEVLFDAINSVLNAAPEEKGSVR